MTAKLTPQDARNALKLLNLRPVLFLVTFLFRRWWPVSNLARKRGVFTPNLYSFV